MWQSVGKPWGTCSALEIITVGCCTSPSPASRGGGGSSFQKLDRENYEEKARWELLPSVEGQGQPAMSLQGENWVKKHSSGPHSSASLWSPASWKSLEAKRAREPTEATWTSQLPGHRTDSRKMEIWSEERNRRWQAREDSWEPWMGGRCWQGSSGTEKLKASHMLKQGENLSSVFKSWKLSYAKELRKYARQANVIDARGE